MTTFTIDTDNNITAFAAAEQISEGQDRFTTEKEFAKLSTDWPITRSSKSGTPSPERRPSAN